MSAALGASRRLFDALDGPAAGRAPRITCTDSLLSARFFARAPPERPDGGKFFRATHGRLRTASSASSRHAFAPPVSRANSCRGCLSVQRNPCPTGISSIQQKSPDHRTAEALSGAAHASKSESARRLLRAVLRRCPPFVKRIRCFLRVAVVIGAQCTRFAIALFRYRHLIMARRAVWRRRPRRRRKRRRRRSVRRRSCKS